MWSNRKIDELYFSKQSFDDLKQFLLIIKESYELSINQLLDKTNDIPKLNSFLEREGIYDVWDSLINNKTVIGGPFKGLRYCEAKYASGQLWVLDGGLTAQVQQMRL